MNLREAEVAVVKAASLTLVRASVYYCLFTPFCPDCNIMFEAVPSRIYNESHRRRWHLARAMNSLLLLLFFYGATCGLIHSHVLSLPPDSTFEATLDDARETDLTIRLSSTGQNCLLCQFHQQLSHGLLQTTPFAQQPTASIIRSLAATFNNFSAPHESSRGRAPPSVSLL